MGASAIPHRNARGSSGAFGVDELVILALRPVVGAPDLKLGVGLERMSNAAKHRKKAAEFEQLKQIDRAIASYIRAVEESENEGADVDVALLNKVGDLTLRQGRVADAVTYYERAVEHYATAGLFNNAIALCNKILRSAPGRANVYFTLGRICAKKGLRGDATRNFLEYATRMQQDGRIDEGMRALAEVSDLMPELTEVGRLVEEHAARAGIAIPRRKTPAFTQAAVSESTGNPFNDKSSELIFLDVGHKTGIRRDTPPLAPRIPTPAKPVAITKSRRSVAGEERIALGPASLEPFLLFDPSRPNKTPANAALVVASVAVQTLAEAVQDIGTAVDAGQLDILSLEVVDVITSAAVEPTTVEYLADPAEAIDPTAASASLLDADVELALAEAAKSESVAPLGDIETTAVAEATVDVEVHDKGAPSAIVNEEVVGIDVRSLALDAVEEFTLDIPIADSIPGAEDFVLDEIDAAASAIASATLDDVALDHAALDDPDFDIVVVDHVIVDVAAFEVAVDLEDVVPTVADPEPTSPAPIADLQFETNEQVTEKSAPETLAIEVLSVVDLESLDELASHGTPAIDGLVSDATPTGRLEVEPVALTPFVVHDLGLGTLDTAEEYGPAPAPAHAPAHAPAPASVETMEDLVPDGFAHVADDPDATLVSGAIAVAPTRGASNPRSLTPISISPIPEIDAAIEAGALAAAVADADPEIALRRPPFRLDPHDFILPGELPPLTLDDAVVDAGLQLAIDANDEATASTAIASAPATRPETAIAEATQLEALVPAAPLANEDGATASTEATQADEADDDADEIEHLRAAIEQRPPASVVKPDTETHEEPSAFAVVDDADDESPLVTPPYLSAIDDEETPPTLRAVSTTPALPLAAVAADANVVATSRRDELRAAVARAPHDWVIRRRLAEALFEVGEREGGLAELQASLTGFAQAGHLGVAGDIADELVHTSPDRIPYHQKRVELAVRLNDSQRLRVAYLDLADTLVRAGDEVRAHAVYARVLEIDPWDERARAALGAAAPPPPPKPTPDDEYVDLAQWLRDDAPVTTRMRMPEPKISGDEQADFESLLRHFKEGVARVVGEDDFESHYDLGVAYKEMGLLDDAIAEFQKALRSRKHRLPAYEALGQCFVEQSRHAVAATVLTRALHEPGLGDQHRIGLLYLLAYSCEALQRRDEARSYYSRVYATDINFRDVAARLAALDQIAR